MKVFKDASWQDYALLILAGIAGGLAIHWGLLNFIAPGPKKLSKKAQKEETRYIGMVAVSVVASLQANPSGDPLANLPMPSHG